MLINSGDQDSSRQQANLPSPHPTSSFWHNDPSSFLLQHRTTSHLPETADVVIIGAGISGAFAALKLSEEEDLDVVMLEAREACWGATGRNGGHCQPVLYEHSVDISTFQLRNFKAIGSLIQKHNISCEWEEMDGGGCHAYYSEDYFEEAKKELAILRGSSPSLASQVHAVSDKAELAKLRIPTAVGAVIQRHAAKLSPYKLISWILEHVIRKSKLNLQTNTPALTICRASSSSKWNIRTPRGTISAPHVLLTTNAYTGQLVPKLRSLIVPVRGQMSALVPPKQLLHQPLKHTYSFVGIIGHHRGHNDYLIQRPISSATSDGGQLMFGGGRSKAKNEGVNVSNDDAIDEPVAKYLRMMLTTCMDINEDTSTTKASADPSTPEPNTSGLVAEKDWTGIMGFSRDNYPWVGALPDMPGLWLSAGFTGSGMPNGALSSQHAASLILAASSKDRDWRRLERQAVRNGDIPAPYVISAERMERARKLPEVM